MFVTDTTDVILDINGYFVPTTTSASLAFYPLTPCRVVDTRFPPLAGPSMTSGQTRTFPSSSCNVLSSAQAYSLNFTEWTAPSRQASPAHKDRACRPKSWRTDLVLARQYFRLP